MVVIAASDQFAETVLSRGSVGVTSHDRASLNRLGHGRGDTEECEEEEADEGDEGSSPHGKVY